MSIHVAPAERTVRTPPRPAITSCTSSEARQHRDEDIHLRGSAAMTALVAGVAGTAAAYAGALPDRVQEVAHVMVGAPAPHHGGPQRPAVPAPLPDTQPVPEPHPAETASRRSGTKIRMRRIGTSRCPDARVEPQVGKVREHVEEHDEEGAVQGQRHQWWQVEVCD